MLIASFARVLSTLLVVLPAEAVEWRTEGPFVGNVTDITFDAKAPKVVYAATINGGIWRSIDRGRSWSRGSSTMASRHIDWVMVDPANDATIWAGLKPRGGRPGMWRSTDHGTSWEVVTGNYLGVGPMHAVGRRIAFSPTRPGLIYIPTTSLHYRSTDGGTNWSSFRVPNQDAYVFAFHPADSNLVLAGGRGDSLNISRTNDGGQTWHQTGAGLGKNSVRSMFFDAENPEVVYAVAAAQAFRSMDQATEWTRLTIGEKDSGALYDLVPGARGAGELWATTKQGVFRSKDRGDTWTKVLNGLGGYLVKTLAFDPEDSSRILAGASGSGIFESVDGGGSWSRASAGLSAGSVKRLHGSPSSEVIFAQMSVGLYSLSSSGSWKLIDEPFEEPIGVKFDTQGDVLYAYGGGNYWLSHDEGQRWKQAKVKQPSMRDLMKGQIETPQFGSLVQDAGDTGTFFTNGWVNGSPGTAIFKTADSGKNWKPSGHGLPGEPVTNLVAVAPDVVIAQLGERNVSITKDGGVTWVAAEGGLPDADIRDLIVDRASQPRLFAATEQGLFLSDDLGTSWSRAGSGIKGDDVRAVVPMPSGDRIFAGTFYGVFESADHGHNFQPIGQPVPHSDVRALVIGGNPNRLWAGTAGGSVFSRPLP